MKMNLFQVISLSAMVFCVAHAHAFEDALALEYQAPPTKKVSQSQYDERQKQRELFAEAMEGCRIKMGEFKDGRQNKDTLGSNMAAPLLIKDVDQWLLAVKSESVSPRLSSYQTDDATIVLEPTLTRLYAYAENMNIHGVSAVKMDVFKDGVKVETKRYRGLGSRTNMMNRVTEYHDAANRSIDDLIDVMIQDLPNICGATPPATAI